MNRMNISKVAMLVAVMIGTSSFFAMGPTKGWMADHRIPKFIVKMPLGEGSAISGSPEITSLAVDGDGNPWVTTKDGRVFRCWMKGAFGSGTIEWQDVSSIISNYHDKKMPAPSKFKYVAGSGGIYAIDEDGQIYRWLQY